MNKLVRITYYGNIFYGLCAVALCIETNLLQALFINHFPFYLVIFFGSWIYYTMIYVRSTAANANNDINQWYRRNLPFLRNILYIVLTVEAALLVYLVRFHEKTIHTITPVQWLLLMSVPVAGALYTFHLPIPFLTKFRQIGWLKPFIIGITWAGWVTVFPVIVWQVQYASPGDVIYPNWLLYAVNFLFITVLAIVFDVKDYSTDVRKSLKTIPAIFGIESTYRYVVLPGTIITIGLLILFQVQQQFTFAQSLIQHLPMLLLLVVAMVKPTRTDGLFYLVVIDGLMMLKALTGIISIKLF